MLVHSKVLLLSCIAHLLPVQRVFAGDLASFHMFPSESKWAQTTETYSENWAETQTNLEEAGFQTYVNDQEKVPQEDAGGILLLSSGGNVFRFPGFSRRLHVSKRLLLVVIVLAAGLKVFSALPRSPKLPFAKDIEKERTRLEKIKRLLPAASRLASAVDTPESRSLLKRVQEVLQVADKAALEAENIGSLQKPLSIALEAIGGLQQAAFKEADAIVRAAALLPAFPQLDKWDEADSKLFMKLEERTNPQIVNPLLNTLQRLNDNAEKLRLHAVEGAMAVSAVRPFKNEEDEDVLLTIAASLEVLDDARKFRKRLTRTAQRVKDDFLLALRNLVLREYNDIVHRLEGNIASASLVADVWDFEDQKSSNLADASKTLGEIKESTEKMRYLLKNLYSFRTKLRESQTVAEITSASAKLMDCEQQATLLIDECWFSVGALPERQGAVNSRAKQSVTKRVERIAEEITSYNKFLADELNKLQAAHVEMKQAIEGKSRLFSRSVVEEQLNSTKELALKAREWKALSKTSLETMKQTNTLSRLLTEMSKLDDGLRDQRKNNSTLMLLKLSSRFAKILDDDASCSASEASKIAPQVPRFKAFMLTELEKMFTSAKMLFRKADTLQEAAKAAADMRSTVLEMQHLLLSPRRKD